MYWLRARAEEVQLDFIVSSISIALWAADYTKLKMTKTYNTGSWLICEWHEYLIG